MGRNGIPPGTLETRTEHFRFGFAETEHLFKEDDFEGTGDLDRYLEADPDGLGKKYNEAYAEKVLAKKPANSEPYDFTKGDCHHDRDEGGLADDEAHLRYRGHEQVDTYMLARAGSVSRYKEFIMMAVCDNATKVDDSTAYRPD